MNSKDKMLNERILGKIEVLKSHIETLIGEAKENEGKSFVYLLESIDTSCEQLRYDNSQELVYRFLYSIHEDLDQADQIMDLVKHKGLIDPEIFVWVSDYEICQALGLQLKDLSGYVGKGHLAMLKMSELKFLDWSEVNDLTGSS